MSWIILPRSIYILEDDKSRWQIQYAITNIPRQK